MTNLRHGPPHLSSGSPDNDRIAPLDVLGLARLVWQGKWVIGPCTALAVTLGAYYAFHMTSPRYAATIEVQIAPSTFAAAGAAATTGNDQTQLNTTLSLLTGRETLTRVITEQGLLDDPGFNRYLQPVSPFSTNAIRARLRHLIAGTAPQEPDAAAVLDKTTANLRAALHVQRTDDSHLITLTAHSTVPEQAVTLANATVKTFIADQRRQQETTLENSEGWLAHRAAQLQHELIAQETAMNDLIGTAQLQEQSALDQLSGAILTTEQALQAAQAALATSEASDAPRTARQFAVARQHAATVRELTHQRDQLRDQLLAQSDGLLHLRQMQRAADTTRANFENLVGQLQQVRLQRARDEDTSRIIAPATTAQYLGPRKLWIIQAATLLGVLIGLGLVALRHALHQGVTDKAMLEQVTGLPVMAQTPRMMLRRNRKQKAALDAGPSGAFAPVLRELQSRMLVRHDGRLPRVILCTSSLAGEGAGAHGLALANWLANAGKGVLFIADSSHMSRRVWRDNTRPPSLAAVMRDDASLAEAVTIDANSGLYMLPASNDQDMADPAIADGFSADLARIAKRYDHVVIAPPPVLLHPTTTLWAKEADAVLYTARWHRTPLPAIAKGLQDLAGAGVGDIGMILTGTPPRAMRQAHMPVASHRHPSFAPAWGGTGGGAH